MTLPSHLDIARALIETALEAEAPNLREQAWVEFDRELRAARDAGEYTRPPVRTLVVAAVSGSAHRTHAAWHTRAIPSLSAPLCDPDGTPLQMPYPDAAEPTCGLCRLALVELDIAASAAMVTDADLTALNQSGAIDAAATLVMATGQPGGHDSQHDPGCTLVGYVAAFSAAYRRLFDAYRLRAAHPIDPAAKGIARAARDECNRLLAQTCDRRPGCHWPQQDVAAAEGATPR